MIDTIIFSIAIFLLIGAYLYTYISGNKEINALNKENYELTKENEKIERLYTERIKQLCNELNVLKEEYAQQTKNLEINRITTIQEFTDNSNLFYYIKNTIIYSFLSLFSSDNVITSTIFNTKTVEVYLYKDQLYITLQLNNCLYNLSFSDYIDIVSKITTVTTTKEIENIFKAFNRSLEFNHHKAIKLSKRKLIG